MKKYLFPLLVSFIFSISIGYAQKPLSINIDNARKINSVQVEAVFEDLSYVILDESKEFIGSLQQILITDDNIYLVDEMTPSINRYTLDGKFLNKYQAIGNGPEEISDVTWINF